MFSSIVTDHWLRGTVDQSPSSDVLVTVNRTLAANGSVSLLRVVDGPALLAVTPERARDLTLSVGSRVGTTLLTRTLADASIALNDPDYLFYLPVDAQAVLATETVTTGTRRLGDLDAAAFAHFTAAAPEADLDEAFIELDHWLAFGSFVDGALVSVASMYPWRGTTLADIGVVTLPGFRGRGLGRATIRAMSAAAIEQGYEPQYRCQLDNSPSVALAESAGFARFGEWEVSVPGAHASE